MSEELKNIEQYQDYLDNSMNEFEKIKFEKRILSDLEFSNSFDEYKELENVLMGVYEVQKARVEIKSLIDFNKPLEGKSLSITSNKRPKKMLFTILTVAASFVIIWFVWQPNKMSRTEVVKYGFASVQNNAMDLNMPYLFDEKRHSPSYTRGIEYEILRNFELANVLFRRGAYNESKQRLLLLLSWLDSNEIKKDDSNYNLQKLKIISWIMLCDINTGNNENVSFLYSQNIAWIQNLEDSNPDEFDFFQYTYSLHLLSQKQNREAKEILNTIVERNGKFANDAKKLRSEIRNLLP